MINLSMSPNEDNQFGKEDLKSEIRSMLWPYYLSQSFVVENLKSLMQSQLSLDSDEFLNLIVSELSANHSGTKRINLMGFLNNKITDILKNIPVKENAVSQSKLPILVENKRSEKSIHKHVQLSISSCSFEVIF